VQASPAGVIEPRLRQKLGRGRVPIDGTLDLHAFSPREVKDRVPEYLRAGREKGILEVRIGHGEGTGALRRTVHSLLARLAEVETFRLAMEDRGSWGAPLVTLRPLARDAAGALDQGEGD